MPQPPILPVLDWKAIYASGQEHDVWLASSDNTVNLERMAEGLAAQSLSDTASEILAALPRKLHVVAIAEDWCGDVVRHVPVLMTMANATPQVDVRFISRAQYPDVFARFLTNGGEAIPKFIFLSEDFVECGHWGPLPYACKTLIARGKACNDISGARKQVADAYAADPSCQVVVAELLALMEIAATEAV